MRRPVHRLSIFKRPREAISGSAASPTINDIQLARYDTFGYKHKIAASGWYDTASCALDVEISEAQNIFDNYLGCRVAVHVDNPIVPIWEGFINDIIMDVGSFRWHLSLDELANRVAVTYSDQSVTPQVSLTASASNTTSIAKYGSRQVSVDLGEQYRNGAAIALIARNTVLAERAFPLPAMTQDGGGGVRLELRMKGFYHTLMWDIYASTSTTLYNASTVAANFLTSVSALALSGLNSSLIAGNGYGIFYNDTDATDIQTNASFTKSSEKRMGEGNWQFVNGIAEIGDGTQRWITGITPIIPHLGYRRAYYRAINTAVEYKARVAEGSAKVFDLAGGEVLPWDVRPDRSIVIEDIIPGSNKTSDNYREQYIDRIEYDSESEKPVTWITEDDKTTEGRLEFYRQNKDANIRFGADQRQRYG